MTIPYAISVIITVLILYIWKKHFTPTINRLGIITILVLQSSFLLLPKDIAEDVSTILTAITILLFFIVYKTEATVCNHKSKIFSKFFLWLVEPAKIIYCIELDKIKTNRTNDFNDAIIQFINESNLDKDLKKKTIDYIVKKPPHPYDTTLIIETENRFKSVYHRYVAYNYNIEYAYEQYNIIYVTI